MPQVLNGIIQGGFANREILVVHPFCHHPTRFLLFSAPNPQPPTPPHCLIWIRSVWWKEGEGQERISGPGRFPSAAAARGQIPWPAPADFPVPGLADIAPRKNALFAYLKTM